MTRKSTLAVLALIPMVAGVAAFADSGKEKKAAPISEKNAKIMADHLDGKVAGKPVSCVSLSQVRNGQIIRISDDTILLRQSKNLIYKNKLRSRCTGLTRDDDIMIFRSPIASHCSGDIFRLVDRYSGVDSGSCSLGKFVPYRKPKQGG